jgi:hypothetical protein
MGEETSKFHVKNEKQAEAVAQELKMVENKMIEQEKKIGTNS